MKRVQRLWFRALELGIDDKLVNLLSKLRVVKNEAWLDFKTQSHLSLIEYRKAKDAKKSKQSARDYSTPHRPPRSIKPTKAR